METKKINFAQYQKFELVNFQLLMGLIGLYFIFLPGRKISYPFRDSRLIYIGMSEKKTNSIGKRLTDHVNGVSGNRGLTSYNQMDGLYFTYFNFDMYKDHWSGKVEDLENYFIVDFVDKFGVYPICNNKSSDIGFNQIVNVKFEINWNYFD